MEWKLFSKKQLSYITESNSFLNLADGPVRSGKTVAALVRFGKFCLEGPPGDLMLMGKTERTIKRNVVNPMRDIWGARNVRHLEGSGEVRFFGRQIFLTGANDAQAEEKIRGSTLAGFYWNELSLAPQDAFEQAIARMSVPGAQGFGDTNPDSPYHWLYTDWLTDEEKLRNGDVKRWKFTLDDNLALDPKFKERLKRLYKGLFYRRMILGEWCMAEGAIYDMWDEARHVVGEGTSTALPQSFRRYFVGIDYGTTNPTVFLLIGEHRQKWYVLREYYWDSTEKGYAKTDKQLVDDYVRWLPSGIRPQGIYHDPSAASLAAEFRSRGIGPLIAADHDVLPGIRFVGSLMGNEQLFVNKRKCPNLCSEITNYVWDTKAQKKGKDAPLEVRDHSVDAMRYALYTPLTTGVIVAGKGFNW